MEFPNVAMTNHNNINIIDAQAMDVILPLLSKDVDYQLGLDCSGAKQHPKRMRFIALIAFQNYIRMKLVEWESPYYVSPYTTLDEVKLDLDYLTLKNQYGMIGYDFDRLWAAYDLDNYIISNLL